ncbi:uncharacterized protein DNG_06221 [Cephalotrichum gorgonifer]|uniref:Protamine P1 n=1 Tax=Cephalotrichum gorgonifer TaxID=2041049 RepID=A0AAE8SWC1_9PEZI|nr:uncharacterized protein DNG_06221 [Cephalotrichum gorgonifer]
MTPYAWDGDDPMADTFYCQIPYSPDDVLQKSTAYAINSTDEGSIGRYENVARQYLSGRAPVLITAALRGPFDAASGFVNPWLTSEAPKPTTFTQRLTAASLLRKTSSPAICEPATSPPPEQTQTTESSCHLPSPESLYAEPHPYLENDEVARVEQWRDTVQSNAPTREEFWSSKTQSSTKRAREDSSWLKRRVEKRPRTVEPEPKLSSPVSIADNRREKEAAASPLATPMTSNGRPTPLQVASQSRNELDTEPKAPTLPRSSQNPKPRSSQRVSQPASPRLPSTSRSGMMRRSTPLDNSTQLAGIGSLPKEGRPSKSSRTTTKKTPPSHSAVARRSSLAVEPKDSPLSMSSDHSRSETSLGQSNDEDALKIDEDIFDADEHPTTLVESDQASEGQEAKQHSLPEEDRVLQEIAPNAAPSGGEAGTKNAALVEDDAALGADLAHKVILSQKAEWKGSLRAEGGPRRLPPAAIVVEPVEPSRGEDEPATAASVSEVGNLSVDNSASSSSSPTDLASPTLVEEGEDQNMSGVAQPPEHLPTKLILPEAEVDDVPGPAQDPEHQEPSTPSLPEAMSCPPRSKTDAATLQAESPAGRSDACPTPHATSHAAYTLPNASISLPSIQKERAVVEVQSPWMKDPIKNVVDHACTEQSPTHLTATEDQKTQSFVVPPEAQSPWMDQPASQPQGVKNAFFSPYSSPQLPPTAQNAPQEAQAPAQTEHFAVESDMSNTDFSIRSFSSFMSPRAKPRSILPFNDHLPHTPSLLAAATENPWQTDSGRKKRVSWAPLPGEADNDVDSPARTPGLKRAASPPPAAPIPDELEGAQVFKRHFATVKSRTNPIRQRLLPSASQLSQRSPETDAMARAFVAASESPLMSSAARAGVEGSKGVLAGERYGDAGGAVGEGMEGDADEVDDVADVLANLDDFLTSWDDETDLKQARAAGRDSCGGSATRRSSRFDLEIGGW